MGTFAPHLEPEFKELREWRGWDYEYCTLCNCWNWNGKHPSTDVHKRNVRARMWRNIDQLGPGHRLGGAAQCPRPGRPTWKGWDPDWRGWNAPADEDAEEPEDASAMPEPENEDYEVCEACLEQCNGLCPYVQNLLISGMSRPELEAYSMHLGSRMWRCSSCRTDALALKPCATVEPARPARAAPRP